MAIDRTKERRQFIIPALMKDIRSTLSFKAVMLNISSKGMRVFSNDQRLLLTPEEVIKRKTFELDFDFFNIPMRGVHAQVVNLSPGMNKGFEKQFGLKFTNLDPKVGRQIEVFVQEYSKG